MAVVRVRESVVVTPADGVTRVLKKGDKYDDRHYLVVEFAWAFESDNVESATASPGERRNVRRG